MKNVSLKAEAIDIVTKKVHRAGEEREEEKGERGEGSQEERGGPHFSPFTFHLSPFTFSPSPQVEAFNATLAKLKELKTYEKMHDPLPKANLTLAAPKVHFEFLKPNKVREGAERERERERDEGEGGGGGHEWRGHQGQGGGGGKDAPPPHLPPTPPPPSLPDRRQAGDRAHDRQGRQDDQLSRGGKIRQWRAVCARERAPGGGERGTRLLLALLARARTHRPDQGRENEGCRVCVCTERAPMCVCVNRNFVFSRLGGWKKKKKKTEEEARGGPGLCSLSVFNRRSSSLSSPTPRQKRGALHAAAPTTPHMLL